MRVFVFILVFIASSLGFEFPTSASPILPSKKVVLITGCSSGIGKELALAFANDNYKVWATMRNINKWGEPHHNNIEVAQLDVTSEQEVSAIVKEIVKKDGSIDIVINNAGLGLAGCLESVTVDEGKALFDINVWGPVRVIQAVLPFMREKRKGYIINISSTSGVRGIPCMDVYTGSKFALEGITDSLRYSVAPYNISITNVNAGFVKTSFLEKIIGGSQGTRQIEHDDGYLSSLSERIIKGMYRRLQSPECQTPREVAQLVLNLAHLKANAKKITGKPNR